MRTRWGLIKPYLEVLAYLWLSGSTAVGFIATDTAWAKQEDIWGRKNGLWLILGYSAPFMLVGFVRLVILLLRSWGFLVRVLDHGVVPPLPGKSGNVGVTNLLAQISGSLGLVQADRLRLTLFVPDTPGQRLVQVSRHRWDGRTEVSPTSIRMGTCSVGHAYNTPEVWYVPDVNHDKQGGFAQALRTCGLTTEEIGSQQLQDRRSFAAVPLFADDVDGRHVLFAILAADTATPEVLRREILERLDREYGGRIKDALLGRTPLPAQPMATAVSPLPDPVSASPRPALESGK